ncbi:MAG: cysteine desulfurase-like protein [Pirellulaceae bacterium]|nr:cysteine desulfurase-like protein [Pirellulaceae bacterium]
MLTDEIVVDLRKQFPALAKQVDGRPAIFFDGPAGTQVPQRVIDAISDYLVQCNANHHGTFATSIQSDALLHEAHLATADFLGCNDADEVCFGANMTTLTFALSRALAKTWNRGDEIVLSRLEHDANFTPWVLAARDSGVTVRYIDVDPSDCTLRLDQYADTINSRTRLVAVGCASNAVGTINPVKQICQWAHDAGALSFLDAVHYAPHDLIDVSHWGCDFLTCSAYKFFGPHVGILYGRRERLETLQPYKLRPAPDTIPGRWMTGTQNHECIAGTMAAIDYIADIGRMTNGQSLDRRAPDRRTLDRRALDRRTALSNAYESIRHYERRLLDRLLEALLTMESIKVWGITDPDARDQRLPTVSISHAKLTSVQFATQLAAHGIFAWHGNYYALPLTEQLGVEPDGMVRIGAVHYNTVEEIDRLLAAVASMD